MPPLTTPGWCRTRRSPTSWRRSSAGATASRRRALSISSEALRCYRTWGADGKVAELERLYEQPEVGRHPLASAYAASSHDLDLLAVAKASQAISMELSWEQVAGRLLEVALEHGGADRGCLLVKRNGDLAVAASANADQAGVTTTVLEPARPAAGDVVPVAVAAFVSRTRERVVLDDAAASGAFTGDPYVLRHKPRSLLCLPIVSQGEVIAVLYLENKLVSGAFTPEHLAALEVIAAQAAIALGTAELFAKLERENAERRRAEAFLEESRGKLQQIMDNSAAAIFVKDGEGRFLLANRAFNELFHLERDEVKGKTDHYLPLPPETANLFRANDLAALREDRAIEFEESVTTKEGEHTYLSVKFPLHDAEGRPYAVCGIATDITGRKRDENQLRRGVSLLRATLESTGDAIVVVDSDGRAAQFNRRFVDVWGEVVEERPFDLARLRSPDAFRGKLEALARHPDEVSFGIVEFADGRIFESYSQPQRMDERVVGRVWSFRDVTVRVGAERERDRLAGRRAPGARRRRAGGPRPGRVPVGGLPRAADAAHQPPAGDPGAVAPPPGRRRLVGSRATWSSLGGRSAGSAGWSACSSTRRGSRPGASSSIATSSTCARSFARAPRS